MKYLALTFLSLSAFADVPFLTKEEAQTLGFMEVQYKGEAIEDPSFEKHTLKWPFEKFREDTKMGNNFIQYQPYSPPGYHGGCDMLLTPNSWVYAPVDGKLEAGHYSYSKKPDGSKVKHWKPWPQRGSSSYFELAIVDDKGVRYELHHIDRGTLTNEVENGLDLGGYRVKKGQKLAKVLRWSMSSYTHIHLNVIAPNGEYLNPEYFFELLKDGLKPEVEVYALYTDGKTERVQEGAILSKEVMEFIVRARDFKDGYIIPQAPLRVSLKTNESAREMDFTLYRRNESGGLYDFRQLYVMKRVRLGSLGTLSNPSSYYHDTGTYFLMRVKAPSLQRGQDFTLSVGDMAGNESKLSAAFLP